MNLRHPNRFALIFGLLFISYLLFAREAPRKLGDDWAFQPLDRPDLPAIQNDWIRNPIDLFILDRLQQNGLKPAPEADRRILARRVSIDLTGLPPTPEELQRFLDDPSTDAYAKYVEQLLASPRYGERWARHWLDVVHYADSHGHDQDRFRPNAWPYRDYLIRAFNEDLPYDRFIRDQIAGDVLTPERPEAIVATGFLAAGPWDESGLRDINENSIDRQIARYLDRDDIVTSTMTTFTGLTVHCARCHDHKFDPISQEDYYSLQAVFAGIDKAERVYDADVEVCKKRIALENTLQIVRGLQGKNDPLLNVEERQRAVRDFETALKASQGDWLLPEPDSWKSSQGSSLKALLDRSILSFGAAPEKDSYTIQYRLTQKRITAIRLELLPDETLPHHGPGRCHNGNLHLSEIRVRVASKEKPTEWQPVKIRSATADFDQTGWGIERTIDGNPATAWGIYPEVGKPHQGVFELESPVGFDEGTLLQVELDQLHGGVHLIGRFRVGVTTSKLPQGKLRPLPEPIVALLAIPAKERTELQRSELARWVWEQELTTELAQLPAPSRVYSGTNRFTAEGSFRPSTTPRVIHLLKRGEIGKPQQVIEPGAVEAVSGVKARFTLNDAKDEGQRRVALAEWIASPQNPLTWRVIVNRVWHYHFGKGIVETPNDLGKMGGLPSHPELLDWLAIEFRDTGGSLKHLHRLIVTSATYRQAVIDNEAARSRDADNRLLWRMNRKRLDAETVRDSVLLASGQLNPMMYGPPTKQFSVQPGVHVTPVADYDKADLDQSPARRRSLYNFIFRTRPDPMLEALDCPDASQSAPVRSESLSAPQALVLWNNKFMLRHAENLAARVQTATTEPRDQIQLLSQLLFHRSAMATESQRWGDYAHKHGLANLVRVLFNSSEFLFVE